MFVILLFMTSPFSLAVGSSASIRRIIYNLLNVCPFVNMDVVLSGKVERS